MPPEDHVGGGLAVLGGDGGDVRVAEHLVQSLVDGVTTSVITS